MYFKLFLSIPCMTPMTPPRAFCRREYEGSSTHARSDVMLLQTSCSDLGGVRSSRHPGALRSWPPHILEVCGVRPILEVCGVRLTPVVCGVGLHRSRRCAEFASPWWNVELASPGGLWGGLRSSPPKGKGRGVRRCVEFRPQGFRLSGGLRSSSLGDVRRLT